MKRLLVCVLAVLVNGLLLPSLAQAATPIPGGVLTFALQSDPVCIEPLNPDYFSEGAQVCQALFGTGGFPSFPAANAGLKLALPAGFGIVGGSSSVSLGTMVAGQMKTVTVTLKAGAHSGDAVPGATVSGLVCGSLDAWRDYPAYAYQDQLGGTGSAPISVTR